MDKKEMSAAEVIRAKNEVTTTLLKGYIDYHISKGRNRMEVKRIIYPMLNKIIEKTNQGLTLVDAVNAHIDKRFECDNAALRAEIETASCNQSTSILQKLESKGVLQLFDSDFIYSIQ